MIDKLNIKKKKLKIGFTLIRTRLCRNLVNIQAFTLISKACKGFTLIELLVVIAIIGVLSTLIMANFVGVRERARDAQRKNDINQIQKALELYKQNQTTPQYPNDNLSLLTTTYLKTVPHDPLYNSSCTTNCWIDYYYDRDNSDVLKYTLRACLENASDPQRDTGTPAGGCTVASLSRSEP